MVGGSIGVCLLYVAAHPRRPTVKPLISGRHPKIDQCPLYALGSQRKWGRHPFARRGSTANRSNFLPGAQAGFNATLTS